MSTTVRTAFDDVALILEQVTPSCYGLTFDMIKPETVLREFLQTEDLITEFFEALAEFDTPGGGFKGVDTDNFLTVAQVVEFMEMN
jgi:hypothetical protein